MIDFLSFDGPCELTGPYAYDLNVVVLWLEIVTNVEAPTDVEINDGIDLQTGYDLTDIIGWEVETEIIPDGTWGPFEEQRLGKQSIASAQMLFAADRAGNDIRTLWNRGDQGYIAILPSGSYVDHPMAPVNVYPVTIAQLTQRQRLRTGGASLIDVNFAIRERVGENVSIIEL